MAQNIILYRRAARLPSLLFGSLVCPLRQPLFVRIAKSSVLTSTPSGQGTQRWRTSEKSSVFPNGETGWFFDVNMKLDRNSR
jgi:hypothetical protein